jgi:hypothetical protein
MITIDSNSYIIYSATNLKKISLIRFLYVVSCTYFKNVHVTLKVVTNEKGEAVGRVVSVITNPRNYA